MKGISEDEEVLSDHRYSDFTVNFRHSENYKSCRNSRPICIGINLE